MTAQQVIDSIKTQFTFKVSYPTTPKHSVEVQDVSTALSLTGTQTIKYLYKIVSPSGTVIYKNAGYDTDTYTTSDKGTTVTYNLPLTTSGEPEAGAYVIYVKAKFADSAFPLTDFTTSKTTTTKELCMCDSKMIEINLSYDVSVSTFTSTDATDYSGSLDYYSLSRTHTLSPPLASGLANLVGSSASLIYTGIWTGVWQSLIQSYVTYRGYNDNDSTYSYFTYYCTGSDNETVVSDSILCKMYCALKSLELKVSQSVGKSKDDYEKKWNAGTNEMVLAIQSGACDDSVKLQYFSDRFYEVTGLDPNCDCCGGDETSAPIINSSSALNFTIGTVTTGTAGASISGTYPNYVLNFVIPAGGGASTISPENYVLEETVVNSSGTNLILYYTGTAGHYAIKEQNQIWKSVMAFGSTPNLAIEAQRFDTAEGVPVFNTGVSGNLKLRKIHDSKIHIKGYFNISATDTGLDIDIIQIPLSVCPAGNIGDKIVKNILKSFMSDYAPNTVNYDLPSNSYGGQNVSIKKIVGRTQFSLVFRQPAYLGALPIGGWYVYVDEIIDLTENVLFV